MFVFACGFACPTYDIQFSPFWIFIGEVTFNSLGSSIVFQLGFCLVGLSLTVWCCSTRSLGIPNSSSTLFSSEIDMFEVSFGTFGEVVGSIIDSLSEELWYFSGWSTRQQGCTLTYVPPHLTRTCLCSQPMTFPGPSHLSQRFLLKTTSPFLYDCVIPVLTWWQSAHLNFSKDSHFINCFLAAYMALRLLATTSLVEKPSNAGSLPFRREGRLGFLPKRSWLGLNPWTLKCVFGTYSPC